MFAVVTSAAVGQKAEWLPEKFLRPLNYESTVDRENFVTQEGKPANPKMTWFVVGDRSGVMATEKPTLGSTTTEAIEFKQVYYVTGQTQDYVQLVLAQDFDSSNRDLDRVIKTIGWVKKDEVLLWNGGLVNPNTKINLKAFLLNKVENVANLIDGETRDFATVYVGPKSKETIGQKSIYDFYFIYKIYDDGTDKRCLLGTGSRLTSGNAKDLILGWVDYNKLEIWDTRICLEPNFTEDGYNERKNNVNFRIKGFTTAMTCDNYARYGKVDDNSLLWNDDPVNKSASKLSDENPRRYKGNVVRFPMLNRTESRYRSGTIGEINTKSLNGLSGFDTGNISEIDMSNMMKDLSYVESRTENTNIFFLVEGSSRMASNSENILKLIKDCKSSITSTGNVKYGGALYTDGRHGDINKVFQVSTLAPNTTGLESLIQNHDWSDGSDNDEFVALDYALNQTFIQSGVSPDANNIIIVIGNNSDFLANPARKVSASVSEDKDFVVDPSKMIKRIANLEPHLLIVQLENQASFASNLFPEKLAGLLINTQQRIHGNNSEKMSELFPGTAITSPGINEVNSADEQVITVKNAITVNKLLKPASGSSISYNDASTFLRKSIGECIKSAKEVEQVISSVVEDGSSLDLDVASGEWSPAIANIIVDLLNKSANLKGKRYTQEDLKKLADEKYKLFHQVYIPANINGASNPAFSYVVFMPHEDMVDYIRTLGELEDAIDLPPNEQREKLFLAFYNLLGQFTGDKPTRSKVAQMSIDELRSIMQGINSEAYGNEGNSDGYFISSNLGFNIGDLMDKKTFTNEQLRNFILDISSKLKGLREIKSKGSMYEYCYNVNNDVNKYYWIPVEYMF